MASFLLETMSTATRALSVQSERMNVIAQNIANVDTPGFKRKTITFSDFTASPNSVGPAPLTHVSRDLSEGRQIHDPAHPLSNAEGYFEGSNVNLMVEMADTKQAQRTYEANLKVFEGAKQMSNALIDLLKR